MSNSILILDTSALCWAARYSMGGLSYRGQPTGIVFGVLSRTMKLCQQFDTGRVVFAWDSRESKRREVYPEYKANRRVKEGDEDEVTSTRKQMRILMKEVSWMGFRNSFLLRGYEADDVVAWLVTTYVDADWVIASSDNDLYQLLEGGRVKMCLISKNNRLYTAADFERQWGVKPSFWPNVKAIAGCSGDNVRGVRGVGERTAVKFLKRELKDSSKKHRDIVEGTDTVRTNWPLVKLPYVKMIEEEDLPELREDRLTWQKCSAVFRQYGFESLLAGGWREVFNL